MRAYCFSFNVNGIELTNPNGCKCDQHKLSMIYFLIEDISDQYQSRINFIQLVAT